MLGNNYKKVQLLLEHNNAKQADSFADTLFKSSATIYNRLHTYEGNTPHSTGLLNATENELHTDISKELKVRENMHKVCDAQTATLEAEICKALQEPGSGEVMELEAKLRQQTEQYLLLFNQVQALQKPTSLTTSSKVYLALNSLSRYTSTQSKSKSGKTKSHKVSKNKVNKTKIWQSLAYDCGFYRRKRR